MSYEVKYLSDEEIEKYFGYDPDPANYENTTYLAIIIDKEIYEVYADGGEPEDRYFGRDWAWVIKELETAYAKGLADGMKCV